jgi:hypothetical protein
MIKVKFSQEVVEHINRMLTNKLKRAHREIALTIPKESSYQRKTMKQLEKPEHTEAS